ncbi:MAG: helix-turn-helix transcriptional regulator [Alphaproteobacteria bacterium]|nr:helix-turn-helix transcriptional regulator [Alphaproteobacteria bacterium]
MIQRAIENYRNVFGLKVPQSIKSFEGYIYDNIKGDVLSSNKQRSTHLNWLAFVIEAVKRRKEQKLTQEQLAVLAGISKPTLNSFEQGKTTIKLDSALKILKVLGLS